MKELTLNEVKSLYEWVLLNKNKNWGTWNNYPVSGCSYQQYDNNPIVIKFDEMRTFAGERFKRISWNRNCPGKEPFICFYDLFSELKKQGIIKNYPEKRFSKMIDGKEVFYLIRQNEYSYYPNPEVCLLTSANGEIYRKGITKQSKYYPSEEI
jgi:hypothetical protein